MNDCEECIRICKKCGEMMFHEDDGPCDICVALEEMKEELNENSPE